MATQSATDTLVDRLFHATIGALELFGVHLGWRLGLYSALAEHGPMTTAELAGRATLDHRYVREWLEQQAVAGLLEVDDPAAPEGQRRFGLPTEHAPVLADPDSPAFVAPFGPMIVGIAGALPDVVDAFRTGAGVPYARYGADFRAGQGAINRPAFIHELPGWLASVPEIAARLSADPPARVADIGCGLGVSTVSIARAYPRADVEGIDADPASIEDARRLDTEGLATFRLADATQLGGPYDLVCIFEALHDMHAPAAVLAAIRQSLGPEGCVLIADERVADSFTAPGDEIERMMYGWSISHCLPSSREQQPSAALGTALRADTVRDLAAEAGYSRTDVLPIENDFFRFYRLIP